MLVIEHLGSTSNHGQGQAITDNANRMATQFNDMYTPVAGQLASDRTTQDAQRADITAGYQRLSSPTGGIDPAAASQLLSGGPGGGSGGGGGGGNTGYLQTFYDLQNPANTFDPTTLNNLTSAETGLANSSQNYGATNTSIAGLQDFAKTGGVNQTDQNNIVNPTLQDLAATGGYSAANIADIRARSNSNLMSTYANMKDQLARNQLRGSNVGPGMSGTDFKLARQNAQDLGTNAQSTEVGIQQAVNAGKLSGATALSNAALGLSNEQSANTLAGYTNSGNLDLTKQQQIENALNQSGQLDISQQGLTNQTRLAATSGLSQDAVARAGISAQASAAQAALAAENQRFLIGQSSSNQLGALSGYTNLYGTAPGQVGQDETYQLNLWNDYNNANQNNINSGIANYNTSDNPWGAIAPAVGAVVGGVGGAMIGGPAGAVAGATVGSKI